MVRQLWSLRMLSVFFILFLGCSEDSIIEPSPEDPEEQTDPTPDPEPEGEAEDDFIPEGTVELLDESKVDNNYILVNDAKSNRVFLMDKQARLLYEWELTNNIGNDVFLLPNGKLLASLESDEPKIKFNILTSFFNFLVLENQTGACQWRNSLRFQKSVG